MAHFREHLEEGEVVEILLDSFRVDDHVVDVPVGLSVFGFITRDPSHYGLYILLSESVVIHLTNVLVKHISSLEELLAVAFEERMGVG